MCLQIEAPRPGSVTQGVVWLCPAQIGFSLQPLGGQSVAPKLLDGLLHPSPPLYQGERAVCSMALRPHGTSAPSLYCPGHQPWGGWRVGGKERRLGVGHRNPMRPPGWAESGLHVWNWKYPEARLQVRLQGVQCCLSSFPRNEKKVTSSMLHHIIMH